ncbi:G-protein coupled receptor Mth2-like isoform X1 [Odontomachus brunneus]|uniref:G-protein coupled receptor Mth2-like isoform X1 n=1 Tax=Odontomachus brunneus TaxID=486640 RepID=UPI0013F25AC6|nr:G-protein coupled receptor Mth2-like isoform X1 [Odontomachus brunneus]XP_032664917.1 G-protein coupled receptor Mth2-like isoform X1 [Odontomachus brunneus]XP_032664918.1 G-protein coupled receptor Mth2-like isoform X1 [Odontomachus brunneus]XP_032664919.1 G-protein coupled receptor Mth2-like isoform X1 [Odontomachus brunneus]XP_032664920.1 G-protein coupled receptor Mth2-like isoform X1 [Odontomachus brunneus]XP_032664921.1 G-protein coupled receptor Mth2-like isoform X1 [Odontomachus bru
MRRLNPIVLCALLLVIAYAAENQSNSTHEDKQQDDTMHYESQVNFTTTLDHDENSTRDNEDSVQHEFYSNYTKNLDENGSQNVPAELRDNSTEINDGGNSTTSQLRPGSNLNERNSNICNVTFCIPICCEPGNRMIQVGNKWNCTPDDSNYDFPEVQGTSKKADEIFPMFVSDPCTNGMRYALDVSLYPDDEYIILTNGSLYETIKDNLMDPTTYCYAVMNKSKYEPTFCFHGPSSPVDNMDFTGIPIGMIVSLPFLLLTFVVYTILPNLWNTHGHILRGYVGSLFVAYISLVPFQLLSPADVSYVGCIGSAFVIYFSFQASYFWLNVMCFDIWWTFSGFRSSLGNVKLRERNRFIMYSIYAWSCPSCLTILCLIMDFVPDIPETLIKPGFGIIKCWFSTNKARSLYFYVPMSITIICNIFLFISMAFKIVRHKKGTTHQLSSSESKRHNDNKRWFKLYLKLFIVMGINWSMEIISWVFKGVPISVWHATDMMNALQGIIIFIIFVCKDKIRKGLLKKFGCREDLFSINSKRNGCNSKSTPRNIPTGVTLQEKIIPYIQNWRAKKSSDKNSTNSPNV